MNVFVIGGGAAGFFAAINCAQMHPSSTVTLIEKTNIVLRKVKISGGGRCNVTHASLNNSSLVKNYPRGEKELRNTFSRFTTTDTVNWFESRGVKIKTEEDGRMFPISNNSETIVNCLLQEAEKSGVKIKLGIDIKEIIINKDGTFSLHINGGGEFNCDKLIIATGGNAQESAYDWLKKLGHSIISPIPSLFTFNIPHNSITELMGISVANAKIKIPEIKLESEGPLIITHWGLSGPAILKSSAWGARQLNKMEYNFKIEVKWIDAFSETDLRNNFDENRKRNPKKTILNNSLFNLPKRLWEYLAAKATINSTTRWSELTKHQTNEFVKVLLHDEYMVMGKTTFKEEFVTCGGIDLKEIDFTTMQSKVVKNLFFAGEVINVDGITGGFNFQNAWSTAWVAAKNIV